MICDGRNSCILPGFEIDILIAIDDMTYKRIYMWCHVGGQSGDQGRSRWGLVGDGCGFRKTPEKNTKREFGPRGREIGAGNIPLRPAGSMLQGAGGTGLPAAAARPGFLPKIPPSPVRPLERVALARTRRREIKTAPGQCAVGI